MWIRHTVVLRERAHLEVHVGVEDLRAIPHRRRHQRILLRHVEQHLKDATLIRCVLWALRTCEASRCSTLTAIAIAHSVRNKQEECNVHAPSIDRARRRCCSHWG